MGFISIIFKVPISEMGHTLPAVRGTMGTTFRITVY